MDRDGSPEKTPNHSDFQRVPVDPCMRRGVSAPLKIFIEFSVSKNAAITPMHYRCKTHYPYGYIYHVVPLS